MHHGRIEYGNIGNYYIVEVAIRELKRVFPNHELLTTFQMTDDFIKREQISVLPLEYYYNWAEDDVQKAIDEYSLAINYSQKGKLEKTTEYIDLINKCDFVFDFSGEMWGDHADPVGENRFLVNLLKMRTAQLLGIKTVLLAGSQGPFVKTNTLKSLAKEVYINFYKVLNREAASIELLKNNGFDVSKSQSFTDPAFLFEPASQEEVLPILTNDNIIDKSKETVGFVLCGFNMLEGPYDKEPRREDEYVQFAEVVEYIVNKLGARVFLMSHQNGFEKVPEFKFINGRDYPYAVGLYNVVKKRNIANIEDVICAQGPYSPKETKAIIKNLDMFVSGRIHAFVAAVSQCVPTVIINRGFGGISHRNIGFATSAGMEKFVSNPASKEDMIEKVRICWENRLQLREDLKIKMKAVIGKAHNLFDSIVE